MSIDNNLNLNNLTNAQLVNLYNNRSKQGSQASYYDLKGLDELRKNAQKDEKGALKQVAKQFESIFMQTLLKQMRKANAAFESDSPLNNRHTQQYRDMYDQQLALNLSESGTLGFADLIVEQLDPNSDVIPASQLHNHRLNGVKKYENLSTKMTPKNIASEQMDEQSVNTQA